MNPFRLSTPVAVHSPRGKKTLEEASIGERVRLRAWVHPTLEDSKNSQAVHFCFLFGGLALATHSSNQTLHR